MKVILPLCDLVGKVSSNIFLLKKMESHQIGPYFIKMVNGMKLKSKRFISKNDLIYQEKEAYMQLYE